MFRSRRRNNGQGGSFGFSPNEQEQHSIVPVRRAVPFRRNDVDEIDVEYVDLGDEDELDDDIYDLTSNPVEVETLEMDDDLYCDQCGGPLEALGQLGSRCWMRCRNCGIDQDAGNIQGPVSNPHADIGVCNRCGTDLTNIRTVDIVTVCPECERDYYDLVMKLPINQGPINKVRPIKISVKPKRRNFARVPDRTHYVPRCRRCAGILVPVSDEMVCPMCRPEMYSMLKREEEKPDGQLEQRAQPPAASNPRRYRRNSVGGCPHCGSFDTYTYGASMGQPRSRCGNCGMDPTFSYRHATEERAVQPTRPIPHPNGYAGPNGFAAAIDAAKAAGMQSIADPHSMNAGWISLHLPLSRLNDYLGSHLLARDVTWYVKGNLLTSDGGDRFQLK